ncbi:MAG: ABC transporter substrate-binding protein [Microscillaceae bacterium]|nr:ABC transporter substrate-binding protein [Microscillaceae bacterium]MDW8461883.1 ABC transporter substrate-binding protein [Cytophagales bacterium]
MFNFFDFMLIKYLKIRFLLVIVKVVLWSCLFPAQAQSKKFKKAFAQLKTNFLKADYQATLTQVEKMLKKPENTPLLAHIYMYKALALLKTNQDQEAAQVFQEILQKFPDYAHQEDIFYQLAHYYLQRRQWQDGFTWIEKIQTPPLKAQAIEMKKYFLKQESLPELKQLQTQFTQDKDLAHVLLHKITATSDKKEDYFLAEQLIQQFNLQRPERQQIAGITYTKQIYNVAVFLPFDLKNLKFGQKNSLLTDLSIALYQGMRIRHKQMQAEGKMLNLKVYDVRSTQKDSLQILLKSPEFQAFDFIVGPLQDDVFSLVAEACAKAKIQILHPLSEEASLIQNPFTYLLQSTPNSKGAYVAQFVHKQLNAQKAIIIFDNLAKNKLAAEAHKVQAEKLGVQVLAFEQITASNLRKIQEILNQTNNKEADYIVAFTTSQAVASQLVEQLDRASYTTPLFITDSWLKFQDDDLIENLAKRTVFVMTTEVAQIDKKLEQSFLKEYNLATRSTPQVQDKKLLPFAFLGYELMDFLYETLQKNGTYTSYRLPELAQNLFFLPKLSNPIDFRNTQDNFYLNVMKYENGQLKTIEPK